MSTELNVIFTGKSAEECDDFIRAVCKHARMNGKQWDNLWIAGQVYDAFSGKALRWYTNQTPEVQKDWSLLQKVLLDQWGEEYGDGGNDPWRWPGSSNLPAAPPAQEINPTPAAAASNGKASGLSGKVGRLRTRTGRSLNHASDKFLSKFTYSQSSGSYDWAQGSFLLTSEPEEAMHVKLVSGPKGLWQLEMQAHPSGRKLVAGYFKGTWKGTWGFLVGVDAPSGNRLRDHQSTYCGATGNNEFQSYVWKLEDGRYLSFFWSTNDGQEKNIPLVWEEENCLQLYYGTLNYPQRDKPVEFEFEAIMD